MKCIFDLLKEYEISRKDLCKTMNITMGTLKQYFSGRRSLSDNMQYRIFYAVYEISKDMKRKSESLNKALREMDFELYKKSVHDSISKEIDLHK